MESIQEIFDEMNDTCVSSEKERSRLANKFYERLLAAYKSEYPEKTDDEIEDEVQMEIEGWQEVTWTSNDWADYYGCDTEDLDEIDSFDGLFDDD